MTKPVNLNPLVHLSVYFVSFVVKRFHHKVTQRMHEGRGKIKDLFDKGEQLLFFYISL